MLILEAHGSSIINFKDPLQRRDGRQSKPTSGTVSGPLTLNLVYYHQFLVAFNYSVVGEGLGYSMPTVSCIQFGDNSSTHADSSVWVNSTSQYAYPTQLLGSTSNERWYGLSVSGIISSSTTVSVTYYHQYSVAAAYSVVGGGNPAASTLSSTSQGSPVTLLLGAATRSVWVDGGVSY